MGGLFGTPQQNNNAQVTPSLTGMPVQSSCYGQPICITWGTTRNGCNLIWYANFNAVTVNQPSSGGGGGGKGGVTGGGGGKGGGGGGSSTTNYFADLAMAICEGPIDGIGAMWKSQTETSPAAEGLSIYLGAYAQSPWVVDPDPNSGVAGVAASQYALGTSAQMPNFNFETIRLTGFNSLNGLDVDPSEVISDIITNPYYGTSFPIDRLGTLITNVESHSVPGSGPYTIQVTNHASFKFNLDVVYASGALLTCVSSSPSMGQYSFNATTGVYTFSSADASASIKIGYVNLTGWFAFQNFTLASGLWVSPSYTAQVAVNSIVNDLCTDLYASPVWSSGVLTLVPRGCSNVSANGYSFVANVAALYDLTDDDFLPNTNSTGTANSGSSDDPVILTRSRPADQINDIKLEYLDRSNQYAPSIAEVTDQANIDAFGKRSSSSRTSHQFADVNAANTSAQLQMQDQYIRNNYSFSLDQRYCLLDPMDVVSLTDSNLGITRKLVRITEITENDDGTLSMTAEELPVGTGAAALYSFNQGAGFVPNYNLAPGNTNPPYLFAAPPSLAGNQGLEIWVALSGSVPSTWGGCEVWASGTSSDYRLLGLQRGAARMGVTTTDFPVGSDPDTTHSLGVDLTESAGTMLSGTQQDADQANTLCLVRGTNGDEYVSYQNATLTAANKYTLGTYIRRGQYSTVVMDHPIASPFVRIDQLLYSIPYQASQIGQTLFLKFPAFNNYDGGQESLADVPAYSIVLPPPPPPPDVQNFGVSQNGNVVAFAWDAVDYPAVALSGYFLGYAPQGTTDWADFALLTEASSGTEMTNAEVPPGTWVFGIRAASIANKPGTTIGLSPDITMANLVVVNAQEVIYTQDEAPSWPGTKVNLVQHFTGVLTPDSVKTVDQYVLLSAPAAPAFSQSAGGALLLRNYYGVVTWLDRTGETLGSSETGPYSVAPTMLASVGSPASPPATAAAWNLYASTGSGTETLQNASPIPIGSSWTEPLTGLVSGAALPTFNSTGDDAFFFFVPDVVASCSYTTGTIDTGYDADLRVFTTFDSGFGFDQMGTPSMGAEIDTWLTGSSDPGAYVPWTIGYVTMRYLRDRLVYDPVEGSVSYLTDFTPTVDTAPEIVTGQSVVIAASGTTITFPMPFHFPPQVVGTPISSSGLYVTVTSVTSTQCVFHVWNSSGVDVGGTINYTATGE